jgi:allantoinase
VIDSHVHFNEPGRAEWEGIATGSRACAAGGTTTYFDMPLNSTPPVVSAEALNRKRAIGEEKSFVDFALWGGLIPGNVDALEGMRDAGAIALKAFMSDSGIDDFPKSDPATLKAGMKRAAELGMIVGVHAEIDHPEYRNGTTTQDYLDSRPISMELEAISLAVEIAGETGCALHVVHVSSAAGVAIIAKARERGVNVTCETCPHYLVLNEDDMGGLSKCAPPLRPEVERQRLLEAVRAGKVQTLGSDHSPAPMSMKTDPDFFRVWGGISGAQHLLRLALDMDLPDPLLTQLTVINAAERFGIAARKRGIEVGGDADLVLVESPVDTTITSEELFYRHKHSPYVGRTTRSRVKQTFLRGQTIWKNGEIVGSPRGQFLRP